jgi:hypothetical protein
MALILPRRIYFRNVGLEIFRYPIASPVVKTISLSFKDMDLPPFVSFLVDLRAKHMPKYESIGCKFVTH